MSTFLVKKCTPQKKNPGYAYGSKLSTPNVAVFTDALAACAKHILCVVTVIS